MSTEAIEQAATNREAALLATADAEQARRAVLLWQKPILADAEIPEAIGIPGTLWETQKSIGDTPKLFMIGRRMFVKTDDLRAWLDAKAASGKPGSRKLREGAA